MATDKLTHQINGEITVPEVRLIDADGQAVGVMKLAEALRLAEQADIDLVLISPNAQPPVCKLVDYGKFKYQEAKKAHQAKLKQKVIQVKEVKFRPGTAEGDYKIKLRQIKGFLDEGDRVKITLRFRSRENLQGIGMNKLERLHSDLGEIAQVEQSPKLEGRQMVMLLAPKKGKQLNANV